MDYHSMSLIQLKRLARDHDPPIKHYYIKKRVELIHLLSMKQLPQAMILEKKRIVDLRKEGKARGYKVYNLKKQELIELLYPRLNQNNQNNNHTQKHDNPQKANGQ